MQEHDLTFVRAEMAIAEAPPKRERGSIGWARKNLFASAGDTILTLFGVALIALIVPPLLDWVLVHAQWTGTDRAFCATKSQGGIHPDGWSGACWAFVGQKFQQFVYGLYPVGERWRVNLAGGLFVLLLAPLMVPRVPRKGLNALLFFIVLPVISYFLLLGGHFGLAHVETPLWGGLMVTLILSFVGIVTSFPIGIALALGRRSRLPVVKSVSVSFIEIVRGVPLVTVLFMASVMLPLFLPPGTSFDKLLRALIGISIFAGAYMAEVIRGGLQAVPRGQYEGADSLGLSYWQKMGLIVLPQAVKLVIPGIVNEFIGLFKDTTLVYIIGMFDLLGTVTRNFADAKWASPQTPLSGLVFAGFVYWCFCFAMSRYSQFMERRLDRDRQR
ncbi:MAG: amino acid ABC transporter permease [Rhizobiaceae bacterium]|nr:MAG: amino acid ABC transporter permease [Rhizobiaceae bacterium]